MAKIVNKRVLNEQTILMDLAASEIANKAKAGQFIIYRLDEQGEISWNYQEIIDAILQK